MNAPASPRLRNFSAGPAILPPVVFERAAEAIRELRLGGHDPTAAGIGLSILEISHRSPPYDAVTQGAEALCYEVLGIPQETHQVLFLQGGASLQFAMVPMNLRRADRPACYIDTGVWSQKAIAESKVLGETRVVAAAAPAYDHIPELPAAESYAGASYLHITTNNTIYGTEWSQIPAIDGDVPLVVDCSSDIGGRPFELGRAALGYAGAQKNLGPSGVTLVFVRRDLLEREPVGAVPRYLRYATHAKEPSLYNTPNTFGVLVLKLMLEWMKGEGGVPAIAARNERKAGKIYAVLDQSALYRAHARPGSRSWMNVTWTLAGAPEGEREALTARFLKEARAAGFDGLKGHRSVGGVRASIYNAFPEDGVDELVDFLRDFEKRS